MEDFAAADTPELDAGADSTSVDDGSTQVADDGVQTDGAEPALDDGAEPALLADPNARYQPIVDGKLDPKAAKVLESLKATDPKMAKSIERALFAEARLLKELPGGFNQIQKLNTRIQELAGHEGIEGVTSEINGWREFDTRWTNGDPALFETLTGTPELDQMFQKNFTNALEHFKKVSPDEYTNLAPKLFDEFRGLNPTGFNAYVGQVLTSHAFSERIPLALERLADFLPADQPGAKAAFDRIFGFFKNLEEIGKGEVTKPKAATSAPIGPDPARAKFDQEKTDFRRNTWKSEADQGHASLFRDAWAKHVGTRQLKAGQSQAIRDLYAVKLGSLLKAKADFNPSMNRFFAANQKENYLRLHQSTFKEAVPLALRQTLAAFGIGKPGPKAAAPGAPTATKAAASAAKPQAGWTQVSQKPDINLVDKTRTTPAMAAHHQYVMRDGKRLQWTGQRS